MKKQNQKGRAALRLLMIALSVALVFTCLAGCDFGETGGTMSTTAPIEIPSGVPSVAPTEDSTETEAPEEPALVFSEGLEYRLLGYTYEVAGIGTCTDTTVVIPDTYDGKAVTNIGEYAFSGCDSLTSTVIPASVRSIGEWAFFGCDSLVSVTFDENSKLTSIGDNAFGGSSLESITIPENVTSIGETAFYDCDSLVSVVIPEGVTSIGETVFYGCDSLVSVVIPEGVTSIGNEAFQNCGSLTSITIPASVTSIGSCAFYGCSSLTSVMFGENSQLSSIGAEAFWACISLTSITIPESVTSISNWAFFGCYRLVEVYDLSTSITVEKASWENGYVGYYALDVYISKNVPSKLWTDTNGYQFYENGNICYLLGYVGNEIVLTLPEHCNGKEYAINKEAFYTCDSLASIVIPDSVTSIGSYAFDGCSSLASVYYGGTEAEWGEISIEEDNSDLTSATIYYYSETEPTESGNYWRYDKDGVPTAW